MTACLVMAAAAFVLYLIAFDSHTAWSSFFVLVACVICGVIAANYQAVPMIIVTLYIAGLVVHDSPLPSRSHGLVIAVILFVITTAFWSAATAFGVWLATRRPPRRRGRR